MEWLRQEESKTQCSHHAMNNPAKLPSRQADLASFAPRSEFSSKLPYSSQWNSRVEMDEILDIDDTIRRPLRKCCSRSRISVFLEERAPAKRWAPACLHYASAHAIREPAKSSLFDIYSRFVRQLASPMSIRVNWSDFSTLDMNQGKVCQLIRATRRSAGSLRASLFEIHQSHDLGAAKNDYFIGKSITTC
jgi:hypothetical protein